MERKSNHLLSFLVNLNKDISPECLIRLPKKNYSIQVGFYLSILFFTIFLFTFQKSFTQDPTKKYKSQIYSKGSNLWSPFDLIMDDKENDILWFKSDKSIFKYEKDTFYTFVKEDEKLVKYTNESIISKPSGIEKYLYTTFVGGNYIIDNKCNIWIKENNSLVKLVGSNFEKYDINSKYILEVNAITEEPNGNIWVSTRKHGLIKVSEGQYYYYDKDSVLLGDNVYLTFTDSKNNIWFCTEKGLNIYNGESFIQYDNDTAHIIHQITSFIEPDDSTIWLSSYKGHVSYFNGKTWTGVKTKTTYFAHPSSNDLAGGLAAIVGTPLAVEEFPTLLIKDIDKSIYLMDFYTNFYYKLNFNSDTLTLEKINIETNLPYIKRYRFFHPSIVGWTLPSQTHFKLSALCNKLIDTVPKDEMYDLFIGNNWIFYIDHKNNLWFNNGNSNTWRPKYSLVKYYKN